LALVFGCSIFSPVHCYSWVCNSKDLELQQRVDNIDSQAVIDRRKRQLYMEKSNTPPTSLWSTIFSLRAYCCCLKLTDVYSIIYMSLSQSRHNLLTRESLCGHQVSAKGWT